MRKPLEERLKVLSLWDKQYVAGQTREHNVLSADGHEWVVSEENDGQTRHCRKCCLSQCCPPHWVPIPHTNFSTEDIEKLILMNEERVDKQGESC